MRRALILVPLVLLVLVGLFFLFALALLAPILLLLGPHREPLLSLPLEDRKSRRLTWRSREIP
jgi:hypothetical protein